jgi:hypothetical protein
VPSANPLVEGPPGDVAGAVAVIAMRGLAEGAGQLPFLRFIAPLNHGIGDDVIRLAVRADRRRPRRSLVDDPGRLLVELERIEK